MLAVSCIQKWLPALSGAGIVVDWGISDMTDTGSKILNDSITVEDLDEDAEWLDDEDCEENDNDLYDSYDLDD